MLPSPFRIGVVTQHIPMLRNNIGLPPSLQLALARDRHVLFAFPLPFFFETLGVARDLPLFLPAPSEGFAYPFFGRLVCMSVNFGTEKHVVQLVLSPDFAKRFSAPKRLGHFALRSS